MSVSVLEGATGNLFVDGSSSWGPRRNHVVRGQLSIEGNELCVADGIVVADKLL